MSVDELIPHGDYDCQDGFDDKLDKNDICSKSFGHILDEITETYYALSGKGTTEEQHHDLRSQQVVRDDQDKLRKQCDSHGLDEHLTATVHVRNFWKDYYC